ncbi:MAG TPA: winged helix-turn-helix domain-containing protein [Thermoanaerobaculia bacterium]|jgi:DNA-binding winged helix-turn-helix (wHTH) protein/tetratricopeptide (TPR) repeat protein|nr:winged helix-turn-helix domain-containing protein [Thermoanaerobaculia bacterium]
MNAQLSPLPESAGVQRLLFDDFELRLDSGELLKAGSPVKLQPQPFKVLEVLAGRSGEVVSREEIRQAVWGDAFVDFDASLNFCVKEIRRALGDSATAPSYVETVPRRGYRFLRPVRTGSETAAPSPAKMPPLPRPKPWSWLGPVGATGTLLILLTFLVASRLRPASTLPPAEEKAGKESLSSSEPANEAYLRGIYFLQHEEYDNAEASFQKAIVLDQGFAPAYARLALAQLKRPDRPADPEVVETAARRAVELAPNLADAHVALGQILFLRHLDWSGAGRELQRALALDPRSADAHIFYSLYLAALGRHAEAIASVKRARELDPASMMAGANYAWYFYLDHQYEEAIRQAQSVQELLYPSSLKATPKAAHMGIRGCLDTILLSAWRLGDQETALGAAKAILEELGPPYQADRLRNLDEFWKGREQRIQKVLRTQPVDPYFPAKNAMVMGDRERALDLLSRCATKGSLAFPFAAVEPVFDPLHGDPRWSQVLDCLKLPDDAPARQGVR